MVCSTLSIYSMYTLLPVNMCNNEESKGHFLAKEHIDISIAYRPGQGAWNDFPRWEQFDHTEFEPLAEVFLGTSKLELRILFEYARSRQC